MVSDFLDRPARGSLPPPVGTDVIGIDLGGTNLRAGRYRGAVGQGRGDVETLEECTETVGGDRSPAVIVKRVADVVRKLSGAGPTVPVGLGFAGMLEGGSGVVVNSPHFTWRDVPLSRLLRSELGAEQPIAVFNDVNAITYGEYLAGAAIDATDVLAVFVGTGIGSGLICNGALVEGHTGCAAELGHVKVVLDETARPCACGLRGCLEAYIGGSYLQRRARAELRGGARSLAVSLAGGIDSLHPGHLDAAATRGDDYSLDLFAEVAPLLGAAIANAITMTNPSHLILGGGMLSRTPTLCEHVVAAIEVAINPPAARGLTIAMAELGPRAGTVGAALLALSGR